jgi:hypothetical protein
VRRFGRPLENNLRSYSVFSNPILRFAPYVGVNLKGYMKTTRT